LILKISSPLKGAIKVFIKVILLINKVLKIPILILKISSSVKGAIKVFIKIIIFIINLQYKVYINLINNIILILIYLNLNLNYSLSLKGLINNKTLNS